MDAPGYALTNPSGSRTMDDPYNLSRFVLAREDDSLRPLLQHPKTPIHQRWGEGREA